MTKHSNIDEEISNTYPVNTFSGITFSSTTQHPDTNVGMSHQPEYKLRFCIECGVMTNNLSGVCQKCKPMDKIDQILFDITDIISNINGLTQEQVNELYAEFDRNRDIAKAQLRAYIADEIGAAFGANIPFLDAPFGISNQKKDMYNKGQLHMMNRLLANQKEFARKRGHNV